MTEKKVAYLIVMPTAYLIVTVKKGSTFNFDGGIFFNSDCDDLTTASHLILIVLVTTASY